MKSLVAIALLLLAGISCYIRGDCIDTAVAMAMLIAATAWITTSELLFSFIILSQCGILVAYSVAAEFVVYNKECFGVSNYTFVLK